MKKYLASLLFVSLSQWGCDPEKTGRGRLHHLLGNGRSWKGRNSDFFLPLRTTKMKKQIVLGKVSFAKDDLLVVIDLLCAVTVIAVITASWFL